MKLPATGLKDTVAAVAAGRVSARELAHEFLARVEALEIELGAFLWLDQDDLLERAAAVDSAVARGCAPGRLAGVLLAVKDNICTRGVPTTCASRLLDGFVPPYTATALSRLEAAGAVMAGKTNMDEFAMGSSTETSAYAVTRNPWDLGRVPGGSSGGSAAAVAAGLVPAALGSDTGGSVRQPAAFNGITGFKPSYGAVSRYGLVAFASSLDQIGALARSAEDCALLVSCMAGHDGLDSTSSHADWVEPRTGGDLGGFRIGLLGQYLDGELQPGAKSLVLAAARVFAELGAQVEEVTPLQLDLGLPAYYLIAPAEAASNLARYDGIRYGRRLEFPDWDQIISQTRATLLGPEVKRRIILGTYALSAGYYDDFYLKASRVRTLVAREFEAAFERYDLLLGPTTSTTAFPLGEKLRDPLAMYACDAMTIPVNLAGLPAASVPCGLLDGLPAGLQIIGAVGQDAAVLAAAMAYQVATDHHLNTPAMFANGGAP